MTYGGADSHRPNVGLLLSTHLPPAELRGVAALGEEAGFSEIWVSEDLFFTGGVSATAIVLGGTHQVTAGLGVVSAVTRHPAVLALDIATLAAAYPGRVKVGIGLGLPSSLRRINVEPQSPLTAVRESVCAVRRLLDGEEVSQTGRYFSFDQVKLSYAPSEPRPDVLVGAIAPRMLELSGELGDGTIFGTMSSPAFLRASIPRVLAARTRSMRPGDRHLFPSFSFFSVDEDGKRARAAARPLVARYLSVVAAGIGVPYTEALGITGRVRALGTAQRIAAEMPEEWLDALAVAGDPAHCVAAIEQYFAAGATSLALFPVPVERTEELIRFAGSSVLPKLGTMQRLDPRTARCEY